MIDPDVLEDAIKSADQAMADAVDAVEQLAPGPADARAVAIATGALAVVSELRALRLVIADQMSRAVKAVGR